MIRINNIDFETEGMKRHSQLAIPDTTATNAKYTIFSAPVDCVVEKVTVTQSRIKSGSATIRLYLATATASTLVAENTAVAASYEAIELTPSANNSMTAGQFLGLTLDCNGSDSFSKTIVDIKWIPNKHRGN